MSAAELSTLNVQQVAGLRAIADWLERHREYTFSCPQMLVSEPNDRAEMAALARALGKAEKGVTGELFTVRRDFGGIEVYGSAWRELICTPKVVGKRTVPAEPAKPEREEDVIEWECPPALLSVAS